jgi:hypothetical protein
MEHLVLLLRRYCKPLFEAAFALTFCVPHLACGTSGGGSGSQSANTGAPSETGALLPGSQAPSSAQDAGGSSGSGGSNGAAGAGGSSGAIVSGASAMGASGSGGATGSGDSGSAVASGNIPPGDAGAVGLPGISGASDAGGPVGDGASGCQGVAIVPDATGFVAAASNSLGIHGSWFPYSDCVDLKGVNCATVTTPTGVGFANVGGKMCTSGRTSAATGAWGAGIGLELSDGPPQQPYDTVMHGVKGFCFVLSGATIPSTSIRVAFPTQDNNDNAYFEAFTTAGMHSVLFSDTAFAQGSWVTSKVAFEPTKVMLVQFQIPSLTTAPVPWDFCVESMTAVTQ